MNRFSCVALGGLLAIGTAFGGEKNERAAIDPYPLSTELATIERDLTSRDYLAVLKTMIPTDLQAEWQRVATRDNYLVFAEEHGGIGKVSADAQLKAAYDRRRRIADSFLGLLREACARRRIKAPFDAPARLEAALRSTGGQSNRTASELRTTVRALMPAEGADQQWPRLRGPDGQGTAAEGPMPLHWGPDRNVVWKTEIPGRGNSSPVVWNDRIFVSTASRDGRERKILCFRRSDGKLAWEFKMPPAPTKEILYPKNSYASATPVTDGRRVISFFGNGGLVSLDFEGRQEWRTDLGNFQTMHGPGSSPALYKDKVLCVQYQTRGKSLFAAYDKRTGKCLWTHDRPHAATWSTPIIVRVGDHDEMLFNGASHLIAYDPDTGNELWRVAGTSDEAIPMVVVGGGLIFSASGRNGPIMAVRPGGRGDVTATHVVWRNLRGGPHVPSPLYHNGRLYLVNDTGIATCLDAADGKTVWQNRLRGRYSMSPVESGGRILVTSEDGRSTILEAGDSFHVLAENDLGEPVLATPPLLAGRLFFRTEGHLWCIGSPGS